MYRYGLQKMINHNVSYWWNLSGNCIFVLLYRMDLNCWKGSWFRNFRLPCESKSAIFQSTLTPFALFPYCSKGLPGKCIWFKESGGGVSEELSCKGKPYKIVLRIFPPPTAEASNLWQGADFYFFYVTFHSAPFGLREYLCDSSYSGVHAQNARDSLYFYRRPTTILALIIVQSLMWKWFVAGRWSPSPVVEQRWWIMRRGRQLFTWIHPQSELYPSEIHFQVLEVLKEQAATLTGDRVIVLQDKLKKK